jgi:hypothetical protein
LFQPIAVFEKPILCFLKNPSLRDPTMTKEEILKAIRACAKTSRRNPSLRELGIAGISTKTVYRQFGGLRKALESAGLQAIGPGFSPPESTLLLDWADVARKLKRLPSVLEYQREGSFSNKPFHTRYGHWSGIPEIFDTFVRKQGLKRQWRDVLKMIPSKPAKEAKAAEVGARSRGRNGGVLRDRPVYGRPLQLPELAYEPTNESGVIFVFGTMARRLGFVVTSAAARTPKPIPIPPERCRSRRTSTGPLGR